MCDMRRGCVRVAFYDEAMTIQTATSPRLLRAINVAATAHDGHYRKGTDIPYFSHVVSVMHLLSTVTDDEDVLIAGLFHDILEDVPERYSEERMRAEFGDRVVELVKGVTKDENISDWQERSNAYLEHLLRAEDGSVLVSVADKLHNLLSILADHEEIGEDLWGRFNSGRDNQKWWYRSVHELAAQRLPGNPLVEKLGEKVAVLGQLV